MKTGEAQMPGRRMGAEEYSYIHARYAFSAGHVRGKRVLELGCGAGLGLGTLAKDATWVVGFDLEMHNLRLARAHYGDRIPLLAADAHNLPFRSASFDVVTAFEVMQYLDAARYLEEAARVLQPDGLLILIMPNPDRPRFTPSPLSRTYYSAPDLQSALRSAGFVPQIFGAFPVAGVLGRAGESLSGAALRFLIATARALLGSRLYGPLKDKIRVMAGYKTHQLPAELAAPAATPLLVPLAADRHHPGYMFLFGLARLRASGPVST